MKPPWQLFRYNSNEDVQERRKHGKDKGMVLKSSAFNPPKLGWSLIIWSNLQPFVVWNKVSFHWNMGMLLHYGLYRSTKLGGSRSDVIIETQTMVKRVSLELYQVTGMAKPAAGLSRCCNEPLTKSVPGICWKTYKYKIFAIEYKFQRQKVEIHTYLEKNLQLCEEKGHSVEDGNNLTHWTQLPYTGKVQVHWDYLAHSSRLHQNDH